MGLVLFATSAIAWTYRDLDRNIASRDIETLLGTDRPSAAEPVDPDDPAAGRALNILLVGVDDRDGDNARFGDAGQSGVRSDTVILAHVAADRSRVELVSIPRDSWVTIPSCALPDGTESAPSAGKFNGAFAIGAADGDVGYGLACTIRTLESVTDVRVDGFMAVDFTGFIQTIDAIGGVPICVPEDIDDREADVRLDAGFQTLDGAQALGFARARKSLGDGSDIQRIGRQQELLGATFRAVLDRDLLTNTPRLYRFLDAATSSLTTSDDLGSISDLTGLALSLRGVRAADLSFVTVPWTPRGDGANVLWTAEADELWAAIAEDRPLTVVGDDADDATQDATTDAPEASDDTSADAGGEADDTPAQDEATTPPGPTLDGTSADEEGTCG
jgi:LCP family protein required for cell wall assembly